MTTYASPNPPPYTASREPNRDDWEDWEDDDEPITPIDAGEQVYIGGPPPATHSARRSARHSVNHAHRAPRHSVKVSRLKSRRRQKAQNEMAGITLITDLNSFKAQRQQPGRPVKFVDAAALRALEGEPNSASVGNWNWLNKKKAQSPASASPQTQTTRTQQPDLTPQSAHPADHGLSPEDRPIVIGFAMDADLINEPVSQPQTVATNPQPTDRQQRLEIPSNSAPNQQHQSSDTPGQQVSVWSPDTPDTASSFTSARYTSSIYSHMPSPIVGLRTPDPNAPPVPAVPPTFKKLVRREMTQEEEDSGTPCTLFEEDGDRSPRRRTLMAKGAGAAITPDSAASKSNGWWDHVVTPFMEKNFSFAPRKQRVESPKTDENDHWWTGSEPKPAQSNQYLTPTLKPLPPQAPIIVRAPTPRRTPSPQAQAQVQAQPPSPPSPPSPRELSSEPFRREPSLESLRREPSPESFHRAPSPPSARRMSSRRSRRTSYRRTSSRRTSSPRLVIAMEYDSGPSTRAAEENREPSPVNEKPPIVMIEERHVEQPPPYSPPNRQVVQESMEPVRYRAVFPPGHPLGTQFPPSPGPVSPGLSATMTSQRGGTHMTEIPLTPGPDAPLPNRPLGTFVPQEHSNETSGSMTQTERTRRRHEREEVAARKAGGCFRGRGCVPKKGCFGRTGREGRKRRRCCAIICCIILLLLILLAVLLGVLLTRPHHTKEVQSIWVNLTDFPPMPTGVMTVVGPDNSVSKSSCTEPTTLWSCSLPKEQHDDVSPYGANQPTVIMQIQWDNGTANSWNTSNGDPPTPIPRRSLGQAAYAGSMMRERSTLEFNPNPDAPKFKEEWFLGNTTDGIKSDEKGGEPTPFYISLLDTLSGVNEADLVKRDTDVNVSLPDVFPSPSLNSDGTPKPAVMLPTPYQQPVRLYDRGLATEHYGFYSYFSRTIYLKSVTVLNNTDNTDVPLDQNGGCRETEADFLTTWSQTRVLVQIWTRTLDANTSTLLSSDGQEAINGTEQLIRPGTMPYPVTVTLDTHGGEPTEKFVWAWPMNDRQQLDEDHPLLLANKMDVGGTWINRRSRGDDKYGGFDGGTGGCKCQWVNWATLTKS